MPRVVVVGGGLAGCWAAATAAAASEVILVRRALGATAVSSGALDAVPPAEAADPEGWLGRLARVGPHHPYMAGGAPPTVDDLDAELAALGAALGGVGLPLHVALRSPVLVAATTGQVRLAGAVQQSIAAGDLRGRAAVVVIGIDGLHRIDAHAVAAGIAARVRGVRIVAATVRVPVPSGADPDDLDEATVARALEAPGAAEALGASLHALLTAPGGAVDLALLPPILGLDDAVGVVARVRREVRLPLGELLAPPPSPPGWRLQRALERAVAAAGVSTMTGTVCGLRTSGARVTAAVTAAGDELACDALVLAGGRFLGGGLSRDARPREPLLDLPVFVGDRDVTELAVADMAVRAAYRDQPVLGAGLRVDGRCRPVDRFGAAPWANVVACGALLAGIDTTLGGGGLGVVAWSAGRAGRAAGELARAAA